MEKQKSNVAETFKLLLDALEEERKQTAEALKQVALKEGMQASQQVLQRLEFLKQLKEETQRLYENWQNMLVVNQKPKKSLGGMPGYAFRPYILKALAELGGSARTSDVLKLVEKMVRPYLSPIDLERLPSGRDRWRNKVLWERFRMIQDGLLHDDSPRGIWKLSESGWEEARKLIEEET